MINRDDKGLLPLQTCEFLYKTENLLLHLISNLGTYGHNSFAYEHGFRNDATLKQMAKLKLTFENIK